MVVQEIAEQSHEARVALRNEPVQARSTARLTALLDAAASIVDEIGFERLTTAMVAERAGASIGTVYRYFPDRIAVLQALGVRNLERVLARAGDEILDQSHADWYEALRAAFSILVRNFRDEPGYRGLRVGDVIDIRPAPSERTYNSILAERLYDNLVSRFDIIESPESRFVFEAAVEVSDALAARAFARDPQGEIALMELGWNVVYSMISPHFGAAPTHA